MTTESHSVSTEPAATGSRHLQERQLLPPEPRRQRLGLAGLSPSECESQDMGLDHCPAQRGRSRVLGSAGQRTHVFVRVWPFLLVSPHAAD